MPSRKKLEPRTPKVRKFVKGLVAGKSMRKSALEAGFTESMADNAGDKIFPHAEAEFKQILRDRIPLGKIAGRIAEGLDATETRLSQFEGKFTDSRELVSWSERRNYAGLATDLMGLSASEEAKSGNTTIVIISNMERPGWEAKLREANAKVITQ